jgi:glutamate mutase epsilon subunit
MKICYNEDLIQKLAYLANISEKLSNLNKSKQGSQINTLTQNDKVKAFMKKLESWKRNTECNISDMFTTFERCHSSKETEANKKYFIIHLGALKKQCTVITVSKSEWVRNPLAANNISGLTMCEQKKLADISCDS